MEKNRDFSKVNQVVLAVSFWLNICLGLGYIGKIINGQLSVLKGILILSMIAIPVTLIKVIRSSMKENAKHIKEIEESGRKQQAILEKVLGIGSLLENNCYCLFENIENISGSSNMVNGTMKNVSMAIGKTAVSVEKQKGLIIDIQKAIEQTEQLSKKMNRIAEQTKGKVEMGSRTMKRLTDKTRLVNEKSDKVYQAILDLEDNMIAIQNIVQTINNISSRISVLSVNATIESGRAGETGVGFTVVADEIRNLSSQTKMAVIKATEIIGNLNVNMTMCTANMENFQMINKQQTALIKEVMEIFKETNEGIDKVKKSADEVSENMNNILHANRKMIGSIDAVSGLTEETMAIIEETNSTMEYDVHLLKEAKELAIGLLDSTVEMKKYV